MIYTKVCGVQMSQQVFTSWFHSDAETVCTHCLPGCLSSIAQHCTAQHKLPWVLPSIRPRVVGHAWASTVLVLGKSIRMLSCGIQHSSNGTDDKLDKCPKDEIVQHAESRWSSVTHSSLQSWQIFPFIHRWKEWNKLEGSLLHCVSLLVCSKDFFSIVSLFWELPQVTLWFTTLPSFLLFHFFFFLLSSG